MDGEEYVYRHPGVGTEEIVDRHAEAAGLRLARELGLDTTFVADDDARGWKISRFVPEARNLDIANADELRQAMRMARSLHTSGRRLERDFDYIQEALHYERLVERHHPIDLPDYVELRTKVMRLKVHTDADGFERSPATTTSSRRTSLWPPTDTSTSSTGSTPACPTSPAISGLWWSARG